MMNKLIRSHRERGGILVMVAIFTTVIVAALAFAIDVNHLYVVRNELQNAADAGALAGASMLYAEHTVAGVVYEKGMRVNTKANKIAYNTAKLNESDKVNSTDDFSVDINFDPTASDDNGPDSDIQRGHWSASSNQFTPHSSLVAVPLWGVSDDDLDIMDGGNPDGYGADPVFINAVKVTTRRNDKPAVSFFAKLFGFDSFIMEADAVAMIGFSGSLLPYEADQPIVICETYLLDSSGEYECNIGRMLNSGNAAGESTINTAGWSDLSIIDDTSNCTGTASTNEIKPLVCAEGANAQEIKGGTILQANNGVKTPAFTKLRDQCPVTDPENPGSTVLHNNGEHPLEMKLPVVNCENTVGNCVTVVSAVVVNLLYMSEGSGEGTINVETDFIPEVMTDPDNPETFRNWTYPASCQDSDGGNFVDLGNANLTRDEALDALNLFPYFDADEGIWMPYDGTILDRWNKDVDGGQGRWGNIANYTPKMAQWDCFVDHFGLKNDDETMAPLAKKSMYFMPNCEQHAPSGTTSGSNFGVLAEIPVLVE